MEADGVAKQRVSASGGAGVASSSPPSSAAAAARMDGVGRFDATTGAMMIPSSSPHPRATAATTGGTSPRTSSTKRTKERDSPPNAPRDSSSLMAPFEIGVAGGVGGPMTRLRRERLERGRPVEVSVGVVTSSDEATAATAAGADDLGGASPENNHDPCHDEIDLDLPELVLHGGEDRIAEEDLDRLLGHHSRDDDDEESRAAADPGATVGRRRVCSSRSCCRRPYRIGNLTVLCPDLYQRRGWCVVGPHWFGPIVTLSLLHGASFYYARKAYLYVGPVSCLVCIAFAAACTVSLFFVSCVDPGVVTADLVRSRRDGPTMGRRGSGENDRGAYAGLPRGRDGTADWRYCDLCGVHQPPDAQHCPDCNICVEGYDHHCPWMGQCIGKRNFSAFMIFNMSWLLYLIYAIAWVTIMGPISASKSTL